MICPNCSRTIADGSFECPHCHEPLSMTQRIDLGELRWCSVCGALLDPSAQECPKCGAPAPTSSVEDALRANKEAESDREREVADLESAIPPTGPDAITPSSANDVMPRLKRLVVAGVAAIAIVGGAALAITHPWDPNANDTSAKTPFDTSNAGNPEAVKTLESQDKSADADQPEGEGTSSDPIYDVLSSSYEQLGEFAERIDASESSLSTTGVSGTSDERAAGYSDARTLSIEVSNAISALEQTNDGAGAYTEQIGDLKTLGNWLRNRCDGLTSAWSASAQAEDPSSESGSILAKVSANPSYKQLFDDNYEAYKPVQSTGE